MPDGLKAWELLKERPHNIDLILTEENLPSISGYALLTLIMEHEICKNIPVISMLISTRAFLTYIVMAYFVALLITANLYFFCSDVQGGFN